MSEITYNVGLTRLNWIYY